MRDRLKEEVIDVLIELREIIKKARKEFRKRSNVNDSNRFSDLGIKGSNK